ncbi:hypothetical protein BDZ97DRAFT_1836529 [Flammula alnicola]|nr:hypothetical protein BDZ97DRAFT_1836529 [Flammula alnicola]
MSLWLSPPKPKTDLGRYRVLSSTAGVHVSPIQLEAMSIGVNGKTTNRLNIWRALCPSSQDSLVG